MQIDTIVVGIMDDSALEKYIPKYGDRVAVAAFVKASTDAESTASSSTCDEIGGKRSSLIERLKRKVKKGGVEHVSRSRSKGTKTQRKNQDAWKLVGWILTSPHKATSK